MSEFAPIFAECAAIPDDELAASSSATAPISTGSHQALADGSDRDVIRLLAGKRKSKKSWVTEAGGTAKNWGGADGKAAVHRHRHRDRGRARRDARHASPTPCCASWPVRSPASPSRVGARAPARGSARVPRPAGASPASSCATTHGAARRAASALHAPARRRVPGHRPDPGRAGHADRGVGRRPSRPVTRLGRGRGRSGAAVLRG